MSKIFVGGHIVNNPDSRWHEIILRFGGDRYHSIALGRAFTPDQVAERLEQLAEAIRRDTDLNE